MNGSMIRSFGGPRGFGPSIPPVLVFLALLAGAGCSSGVAFRSFSVMPGDPQAVFDTAVEVVRSFYTGVHGGVAMQVDRENLFLVMGPLVGKTEDEYSDHPPPLSTHYVEPVRQKLFLRVLPDGEGAQIEMLAVIETLSIDDPDQIRTDADIWKFKKQDTEVEDQLYDGILRRLVEKGVLR